MTAVKAMQVNLASGGILFTEAGKDRCFSSEEVACDEIEVPAGTKCGICGERIKASRFASASASSAARCAARRELKKDGTRVREVGPIAYAFLVAYEKSMKEQGEVVPWAEEMEAIRQARGSR